VPIAARARPTVARAWSGRHGRAAPRRFHSVGQWKCDDTRMVDAGNRAENRAIVEAELGAHGSELRWREFEIGDLLIIDPGSPPAFRVAFGGLMLEDDLGGARFAETLRGRIFQDRLLASRRVVLIVTTRRGARNELRTEIVPELPSWAR